MKNLLLLNSLVFVIQINAQTIKADDLRTALAEFKESGDLISQKAYFELFPNSFDEFLEMFGYDDGKEAPLYDGYDYVKALFQLDSIQESLQMEKWTKIGINGHWEADAINYFQNDLRPRVLSKVDLAYETLKKYTDLEIESFFYFFFNEIHPQFKTIPMEFEKFKESDRQFYELLANGHEKAIKNSGH